jgi:hypothetical protein
LIMMDTFRSPPATGSIMRLLKLQAADYLP